MIDKDKVMVMATDGWMYLFSKSCPAPWLVPVAAVRITVVHVRYLGYYEIQTLIPFGDPQAQLNNCPLVVVIINFGYPK